jgi:hypothetical protein
MADGLKLALHRAPDSDRKSSVDRSGRGTFGLGACADSGGRPTYTAALGPRWTAFKGNTTPVVHRRATTRESIWAAMAAPVAGVPRAAWPVRSAFNIALFFDGPRSKHGRRSLPGSQPVSLLLPKGTYLAVNTTLSTVTRPDEDVYFFRRFDAPRGCIAIPDVTSIRFVRTSTPPRQPAGAVLCARPPTPKRGGLFSNWGKQRLVTAAGWPASATAAEGAE